MRRPFLLLALCAATAACGDGGDGADAGNAAAATAAVEPVSGQATASATAPGGNARAVSLAGRTRELASVDDFTAVLLYYSLTGLTPPIDKWVENDPSVRSAAPADKAGARAAMKAKIEAGLAALKDVGRLRVTTDASLSDYDPSYGEYTVRALSPSSSLMFSALGERVRIGFDNAQRAQRWSVPAGEAQGIKDRIEYTHNVTLDALLHITGAVPDASGGAITAQVVEYDLKNRNSGTTVARVQVGR